MKTLTQIITDAIVQKNQKGYPYVFWAIDLHDTIIEGKYNRFNKGTRLYRYAGEVLEYLYKSNEHRTILWTSSHDDAVKDVCERMELKFHYYNENPLCPNTELCDFDKKFYFNILLDDKAGFVEEDWEEIYVALTMWNGGGL